MSDRSGNPEDWMGPGCMDALFRLMAGELRDAEIAHIEKCRVCSILVHGGGGIFDVSLFDEAARESVIRWTREKRPGFVPPSEDVMEESLRRLLVELQASMRELRAVILAKRERLQSPHDVADGAPNTASAIASLPSIPSGAESSTSHAADAVRSAASIANRADESGSHSRRQFLRVGIAAAATALIAGSLVLWPKDGRAVRPTNSPTTNIPTSPGRSAMLSRWDQTFAGGGDGAIRAKLARATQKEHREAFEWIAERRKTTLYGDLVAALSDPALAIRRGAVVNLHRIPPIDLKTLLVGIQSARAVETDVPMQYSLDDLIKKVTNA